MRRRILASLIFILLVGFAWSHDKLGRIDFPTSATSNKAQNHFERGILLLHSFEYDEARRFFNLAINAEPDFAMAYWGLAQTYNHPLWNEQDLTHAKKTLMRLSQVLSIRSINTYTPKEQGFIHAIDALYGKGNKIQRDKLYFMKMHQLYKKYPEDNEIAMFYTLALLGVSEGDCHEQNYQQAAKIIEKVFAKNPEHPGALHYAIHSYDDPMHAALGLRAAKRYSKVAHHASHALHMPSHIFFALGMWNEVIRSNKAAWKAGYQAVQKKNLTSRDYTIHDLHALQWLSYAYNQAALPQKALNTVNTLYDIAKTANTPMTRWYYLKARNAFLFEMPDSQDLPDIVKNDDLEVSLQAEMLFAEQLTAFTRHQSISDLAIKQLENLIKKDRSRLGDYDTNLSYFTSVTKKQLLVSEIHLLELKGLQAWQRGDEQTMHRLFHRAINKELKMGFGYGPPLLAKSSLELYAELLMLKHDYITAHDWFSESLKRHPQDRLSKLGYEESKRRMEV